MSRPLDKERRTDLAIKGTLSALGHVQRLLLAEVSRGAATASHLIEADEALVTAVQALQTYKGEVA